MRTRARRLSRSSASAHAAVRAKASYLSAQYHRLAPRRGTKRAALADAHSILVIAYHILKDGTAYADLGSTYSDRLARDRIAARARRRLEALGFQVWRTKPEIEAVPVRVTRGGGYAMLERRSRFGVAAAPDDSAVLFTSSDVDATELMLIERLR